MLRLLTKGLTLFRAINFCKSHSNRYFFRCVGMCPVSLIQHFNRIAVHHSDDASGEVFGAL